jgi:hypothetical protein
MEPVDLWDFYDGVEALIVTLRETGHMAEATQVEDAIRGGATSGEILGRLFVALPQVRPVVPELSSEIQTLEAFVHAALRPR